MNQRPKSLFISHGGGPMPLLGDPGHLEMVSCLQTVASSFPRPDALLIVSAHWEAAVATVTAHPSPALIYDYYGFPDVAYSLEYPCQGNPALARTVHQLLSNANIVAELDEERGFDHGLFVPLTIMYPQADIPCVQLSLVNSLDPAYHLAVGRALHDLHKQNIVVIGSGFSFHNLKAFFNQDTPATEKWNADFEHWLLETCCSPALSEQERAQRLIDWAAAPGARFCHPREEHLLPLHVCYGVAESACVSAFELEIMGKKSSMYLW